MEAGYEGIVVTVMQISMNTRVLDFDCNTATVDCTGNALIQYKLLILIVFRETNVRY